MIEIANKRIPYHSRAIRKFVRYLNSHYQVPNMVVWVYDEPTLDKLLSDIGVDTQPMSNCFGVYHTVDKIIHLAGSQLSADLFLIVLAHEVKHAVQFSRGMKLSEHLANSWALDRVLEFRS